MFEARVSRGRIWRIKIYCFSEGMNALHIIRGDQGGGGFGMVPGLVFRAQGME